MKKTKEFCSASKLAEMGTCERRIALQAKHGQRRSAEHQAAATRGDIAHEAFFREGLHQKPVTDVAKPWCFVATLVYGPDAVETVVLRAFRDRRLRTNRRGRSLISFYYRWSPRLCRWLAGRQWALAAVRGALRPVVLVARLLVGQHS